MKKILVTAVLLTALCAPAFCGNIGTILATDIGIGAAAGAALGAAVATPFFISGGSKDAGMYMAGAGWGFIIGAGAGLAYGIWNAVFYVNQRTGPDAVPKKKAFFGDEDLYLASNGAGIAIIKKF